MFNNTHVAGDDIPIRSFNVDMNLFVLDWGSPNTPGSPWQLLNVFIGWNNVMSYATCLAYCMFWVLVIIYLVLYKTAIRRRQDSVSE